jgi:hypothetical protein
VGLTGLKPAIAKVNFSYEETRTTYTAEKIGLEMTGRRVR